MQIIFLNKKTKNVLLLASVVFSYVVLVMFLRYNTKISRQIDTSIDFDEDLELKFD